MCVALNSYEIWAAVRFSKILVVPVALIWHLESAEHANRTEWLVMVIALVVGITTNLAYGIYMDSYF
jgi:hypothetical protein